MVRQVGGRRQRSEQSCVFRQPSIARSRQELTYVLTVCLRMDSPPLPRGRPHLRIRLMARRCRRLDRIVEDCAVKCTCDNRRAQCAVGSIVSMWRGRAKLEDGPSCKDVDLRGSLGRWRAHTATCASGLV